MFLLQLTFWKRPRRGMVDGKCTKSVISMQQQSIALVMQATTVLTDSSKLLTFHPDRRGRICADETWNRFRYHAIWCRQVAACTSSPSPKSRKDPQPPNIFWKKILKLFRTSSSLNQLKLSDINTNQQSFDPLIKEILLIDSHPFRITCTPRFFLDEVCPWDAFASALNTSPYRWNQWEFYLKKFIHNTALK